MLKIALLKKEDLTVAGVVAEKLSAAVDNGDVKGVLSLSGELMSFADESSSLTMEEEIWRNFVKILRSVSPDFRADYILESKALEDFFNRNMEDDFPELAGLVYRVLHENFLLLQLPCKED